MTTKDLETDARRERFLDFCRQKGWDHGSGRWAVSEIALATGKAKNKISNLIHGYGSFGPKIARELEESLGIAKGALDGIGDQDFLDVPRIDVKLSAGAGQTPHLEDVIGHLKFSRNFLRSCGVNAASARVVDVRGNSMEPTIKDGAVLLVSTNNREPTENQIYALARPVEGLMVKRLVRLDGQWLARSDNRDYADFAIGHGEPIHIIGRAIWMGAKL